MTLPRPDLTPPPLRRRCAAEHAPSVAAGGPGSRAQPHRRIERGERSRERLRDEALRLFAEKGFAQASTRAICLAAGTNAAAIHYYFGDKAGLYRDVCLMPIVTMLQAATRQALAPAPIATVLAQIYRGMLAPLQRGDLRSIRVMRVYVREQSDPTGLVDDAVIPSGRALFEAILALVVRELDLRRPDDDARRLAFGLVAIAAEFLTAADWNRRMAPGLYTGAQAVDRMAERLTDYGLAMLAAERTRRARPVRRGA